MTLFFIAWGISEEKREPVSEINTAAEEIQLEGA
jgi:hypothetical protein